MAEGDGFNPLPLYLAILPPAILLFQLVAAGPTTAASRARSIAHAEQFITDIDAYHARHGAYPNFVSGVWKDYQPTTFGVDKFDYAAYGEGYNLSFEQPRFLLDDFGAREFVVYNPRDEHLMISHASWVLIFTPVQLRRNQGWFKVQDAGPPHWRYFWFD